MWEQVRGMREERRREDSGVMVNSRILEVEVEVSVDVVFSLSCSLSFLSVEEGRV